jgi:hypothetical protein
MSNVFSSGEIVTIAGTTGNLARTPDGNFFIFERNGIVQVAGGVDYTLSGSTITVVQAQTGSDVFEAWYSYSGSGVIFSNAETVSFSSSGYILQENGIDHFELENASGNFLLEAQSPTGTGTLAQTPNGNFFLLTRNGILQQGGGVDYTLTGNNLTFVVPPGPNDVFEAWYSYGGTGLSFSSGEGVVITSTTGTTSQLPDSNFFLLIRNGIVQTGSGTDYTQIGKNITLTVAQSGSDSFDVWYTYASSGILPGDEDFWVMPATIPLSNDFMVTRF